MATRGLTLGRALVLGLSTLTLVGAALFAVLLARWGESLLSTSERLRDAAGLRAAGVVAGTLGNAESALHALTAQVGSGAVRAGDPADVERALFALLLGNDDLEEATLTVDPRLQGGTGPPW